MEYFWAGFGQIITGGHLIWMFIGMSLGLVLGALPGLTGSLGIALMLPFTYHMDPLRSLVFLLSIYTGGLFGGAITAITVNTPGSPSNLMTQLDGWPMTKKGQSGKALGIALLSSTIGGLIGCIFLVLATEPMANFSLKFGNGEMFMVMVFGISCVGSLAKSPTKSIFAGCFGILLSTIGASVIGKARGTYGSMWLYEGLPTVPVLIGLLAIPEVVKLVSSSEKMVDVDKAALGFKSILSGFKENVLHPIQTVVCSVLGVIIGVVPAAGSTVAGVMSYNLSKTLIKSDDEFGTGVPQGVIASETANNASEGGALATMFVLGIPGSASTAMMIGALALQGWAVGPKLFIDHSDVIYTAFSSLFMQQIVMLILGMILCLFASYIVKVPSKYLLPCILAFTMLGAYSSRIVCFDILIMVVLGIIGYLMKKNDFPILPVILGYLLGGDAEENMVRIAQQYDSFWEIFRSPITSVLFVISLISFIAPMTLNYIKEHKRKKV